MFSTQHEGGTSMATTAHSGRRELAVRASNGLEVGLYWSKTTSRVTVEVFDQRLDEGFEFEIDGSHALDAFHHPYAFAATRDVHFTGDRTAAKAMTL
jgi:hypothetical protein